VAYGTGQVSGDQTSWSCPWHAPPVALVQRTDLRPRERAVAAVVTEDQLQESPVRGFGVDEERDPRGARGGPFEPEDPAADDLLDEAAKPLLVRRHARPPVSRSSIWI